MEWGLMCGVFEWLVFVGWAIGWLVSSYVWWVRDRLS